MQAAVRDSAERRRQTRIVSTDSIGISQSREIREEKESQRRAKAAIDTRRKGGSALTVDEGHGTDVNVLSWNRLVNYLVVTGADDGSFRVWDLRSFRSGDPVARFHWHKAAVTSVEWSPHESSTLAVRSTASSAATARPDPRACE